MASIHPQKLHHKIYLTYKVCQDKKVQKMREEPSSNDFPNLRSILGEAGFLTMLMTLLCFQTGKYHNCFLRGFIQQLMDVDTKPHSPISGPVAGSCVEECEIEVRKTAEIKDTKSRLIELINMGPWG